MPLIIPEDIKDEIPKATWTESAKNPDSSGFGLIVWLFDHISERKPVFLSLYQQYDAEVKIASQHKVISWILLVIATTLDMIVFLVYALAVILIIAGITFIFVKGTGLLDYVHSLIK